MACDQTNCTGTVARCDTCSDGAPSAAATGCRPGSPALRKLAGNRRSIDSTQTHALSGNWAIAANPTSGDEGEIDHEYRRTVLRCIAFASVVLWAGLVALAWSGA